MVSVTLLVERNKTLYYLPTRADFADALLLDWSRVLVLQICLICCILFVGTGYRLLGRLERALGAATGDSCIRALDIIGDDSC